MSSVAEITSELICIPSVNPDGGDPGTEFTGEATCAEWARVGSRCKRHERPHGLDALGSARGAWFFD